MKVTKNDAIYSEPINTNRNRRNPGNTCRVHAVSYKLFEASCRVISTVSRPNSPITSIMPTQVVATTTRPKSSGISNRASIRVLINPRLRTISREITLQPAPFAIRRFILSAGAFIEISSLP